MIYIRHKSMLVYLVKPLFIAFLLFGIFGIIWLRSNLISLEYSISELENKKMDRIRETKMLMAERASILSIQKVEKTAVRNLGLVFPDRTRVVYVKETVSGPKRASLNGVR
ncbi:MAG: hypothetical protein OHK0032_10830 [Thermodesulfovibrionales bacterium]